MSQILTRRGATVNVELNAFEGMITPPTPDWGTLPVAVISRSSRMKFGASGRAAILYVESHQSSPLRNADRRLRVFTKGSEQVQNRVHVWFSSRCHPFRWLC